ncbi:MAG: phenylacetic acid degradation operon negative regulatory protein PaaX [Gammaproteobacteria bacterium]|nr:phenylacetic acid degradation operon negative regulatory protein PaaX [Gammaproteobacteria bacterium]
MSASHAELVAPLLRALKPKAKSLLITVYGDALWHHGGCAWLGNIIALVRPFGLNERVVRTSVFRLANDNWLETQRIGRRSFYRLTEAGRRRFDAAHGRIYRDATKPWDGDWTIVISRCAQLDTSGCDALRRNLAWLGYGQLARGVMLHPDPDEAATRDVLADTGTSRDVLVLRGPAASWVAPEAIQSVIRQSWDLDRVIADYNRFLEVFRPVWLLLKDATAIEPEAGFAIRMLLMHGYRRALLRDPMLPGELLPANWPGTAARTLCRNLYRLVQAAAERHTMANLETPEGPAPEAPASYYTRFGGLQPSASA